MKKLIALTLLLCTLALMFSSCKVEPELAKPEDTNLEYWLLDSPNKREWTKLHKDIFYSSYLAREYESVLNEDGNWSKSGHNVVYYTENYPIVEMGIEKITGIFITDPQIHVWGLTVNSTREEVVEVMEKMGFEEYGAGPDIYWGDKGQYRVIFRFNLKKIEIYYKTFSIFEYIIALFYYN